MFTATLVYDRNIFEKVQMDDIEALNGWELMYNEANGQMLANKMAEISNNEELFKVHLKVKENINNQNTQISIENVESARANKELVGCNGIIELEIKDKNSMWTILVIVIVCLIMGQVIGYLLVKNKKGDKDNV